MYDYSVEKDYSRIPSSMRRSYHVSECCVFKGTQQEFGELSNMASGFPVAYGGVKFGSSEALYQACRYPHLPEVQEKISQAANAMQAKMLAKPYRSQTREDWLKIRVAVMRWVLRVKLTQHPKRFGLVLIDTHPRAIVEESSRDVFWGAKRVGPDLLEGANVLGRLLMELRDEIDHGKAVAGLNLTPPLAASNCR